MADLDDFFAKKDRLRRKVKGRRVKEKGTKMVVKVVALIS